MGKSVDVSIYPPEILDLAVASVAIPKEGTAGRSVSFRCGISVAFEIEIGRDKNIKAAAGNTNGCGYAAAAANALSQCLSGKGLQGLHGALDELRADLPVCLRDGLPADREHCVGLAFEAAADAFKEYRRITADGYEGDDPLICTCFGVTEGDIDTAIDTLKLDSVQEVSEEIHAGSGCGSCRMLIQEMIDNR